jgi:hypothetical protein
VSKSQENSGQLSLSHGLGFMILGCAEEKLCNYTDIVLPLGSRFTKD